MFRDSPVPDIFNGPVPDIENIKKKLEQKKEGWFRKRPKKGGSPKKKSKKRDLPKDDLDNFDEVNLDFKTNKKKKYPFQAEVPGHEEMKTIYRDLKSKGWFTKEYNTGGKSAKNKKIVNSKRKTKKVTFKKANK